MSKTGIKVTLDKIVCQKTEDNFGPDEFYVIAALFQEEPKPKKGSRSKKGLKVNLAKAGIWTINDGDTVEPKKVLFDTDVSSDNSSYFKIWCFDQDAADEISVKELRRIEKQIPGVSNELREVLGRKETEEISGSFLKKYVNLKSDDVINTLIFLVNLDEDDRLGNHSTKIPEETLFDIGSSTNKYAFDCLNGCEYEVAYTIEVDY